MASFIDLTDLEKENIKAFKEEHSHCTLEDCKDIYTEYTGLRKLWRWISGKPVREYKLGPLPPHYTYTLDTESGIGVGIGIRCNYCGQSKDVTDYGSW